MKLVVADLNNRGIYRPLDEIYGEYETNDTGLCNRLLCWELVKIINHIHDDKFEIVLDVQQNPETNNCFTLEDTTMANTSDINFDDYFIILYSKLIYLNHECYKIWRFFYIKSSKHK